MITVEQARSILMEHMRPMPAQFRYVDEAVGAILAADVLAADDHPRFDMSAVDGYALGPGDGPWRVVGSIAAGEVMDRPLDTGECTRIFTGAMVPEGTVGVAMQERCTRSGDRVTVEGSAPIAGANIRRRGEGFRADDLLMAKGERLNPAAVGLIASAGVTQVMVAVEPAVAIVRTGDEFIEAGTEADGRIHSSNDPMLIAAVLSAGCHTEQTALVAGDDREELTTAFHQAVEESDVIITTGGVSVGEHDLVRSVLESMGATIHFHGVKQKPGKPMLFATLGRTPVFGLPGNPRAVLVCWYMYVLPFLRAMQGAAEPGPRTERLPLAHAVALKGGRAEFRAAQLRDGMVHVLPDEGSHMLTTMAIADVLAYFPADGGEAGFWKDVDVHYLPRP
jgi:molybdopterin molybdotransferase